MYEPGGGLFSAEAAVPEALAVFAGMGFDLGRVHLDLENRPRKYPGAFCLPVQVPEDVRVSVRIASPHHLVDMLYHEFGHAAHFSGIRADLPFLDRYWIQSGTHETFATLFERLLDDPVFLARRMGLSDLAVEQVLAFGRFKALLTTTWLAADALTAVEAWLDDLAWPEVEARFASNMLAFTGVAVPPAFTRMETFAACASVYPAGYVLAAARAAHWLARLQDLGGPAWWQSPDAQADIRARIALGGQVTFPAEWNDLTPFLNQFARVT
jgi:hypothetical protein